MDERDYILREGKEENGTISVDEDNYGHVQEKTDIVQEDETEERTDTGHYNNASKITKRQHRGAGLDRL